ncbi:hypothetical protein GPA22_09590 [Aromatoleum toluvorans]|uniref:Uncharacterized protein n=1 Tax=Aromatoleum toluvorans TaxID=92002 RepID=A0ABX1PX27_9RHOO|nr:hypothetical protein [Aromatoleum toluvorans]NMG43979.1 hypothetical protein [Aromatoleum toluvorans]
MKDSIFARSQRNELGETLSLEDVARLSRCSLDDVHGQINNDDPLLRRLYTLISLGQLTPAKTEDYLMPELVLGSFGGRAVKTPSSPAKRYFIDPAALHPHRETLGDIGPELNKWLESEDLPSEDHADFDAKSARETATSKPRGAKFTKQDWEDDYFRRINPLGAILAGAARKGKAALGDLLNGKDLKFTIPMMYEALGKPEDLKGSDILRLPPVRDAETLRHAAERAYPSFEFPRTKVSDKVGTLALMRECYEIGEPLVMSGEGCEILKREGITV